MQVKYIGKCPKIDSIAGVGLPWEPSQIRNVSVQVAERLLMFKDSWSKIEGDVQDTEEIGLSEQGEPSEEPLPVIDFHGMDKTALVAFAAREYNERLDKRLAETTIRHQVIALFGKHQAEAE